MRSGYKNKKYKKVSTLTMFVLLVVLGLISWAVISSSSKNEKVEEQTSALDQEIEELQQQNLELTDLIDYFASTEYVEQQAREKLNLVKPGEKVVIITQSDEEGLNNLEQAKELKNSPVKWWRYFFGK